MPGFPAMQYRKMECFMEGLTALQLGFSAILGEPTLLIILVLSVFFGMVMGAIPGLTATLAVTMALPFTYTMSANQGLTMLVAIYVGGIAGGLVGNPNQFRGAASLVTCFDGNVGPNGRASRR